MERAPSPSEGERGILILLWKVQRPGVFAERSEAFKSLAGRWGVQELGFLKFQNRSRSKILQRGPVRRIVYCVLEVRLSYSDFFLEADNLQKLMRQDYLKN